ncbi:MAG: hypothetical protein JNK74_08625 [Candidatus Hydrogenedentes bacterium]|nr:hypothetical protein [Candidatus Hydrogenedentota bacterium]
MSDGYYPGIPTPRKRDTGLLPPYIEAALFLLCGMIIGGGATVLLMDRSFQRMVSEPDRLQTNLLERMEARLSLSEAQREVAAAIVEKHFEALEGIRVEVQPEVKRTLDTLRDEVSAILNDSQRQIWERRFEEVRDKWQPGPFTPPADAQASSLPESGPPQSP